MMKPYPDAGRRSDLFVLLLAMAMMMVVAQPRAAVAQQFLATQIEKLVSSDAMQVKIEGLSGALTGAIRIDKVTVSDPKGVFLAANDLAMDWSPLSLVRSNVSIKALTAGRIELTRLPEGQPASESKSSGLPNITADIDKIAVAEFVLGEAVAGIPARLSANARLVLQNDPVRLEVEASVQRLDQPGSVAATLAYAPADNRLAIDVKASEPAGGLVAGLLKIPGAPPVDLTIGGTGPLSDFTANGSLNVGSENAATLSARVSDVADGRQIAAKLQVAAERFVPAAYGPYVKGGAHLDLGVVLGTNGLIRIDQGRLSSDVVKLDASGTFDRSGPATALNVSLASNGGAAIPLRFGAAPNETVLSVASLTAKLTGALTTADLDVRTTLPTAGFGPYVASGVEAAIGARGFNLSALSGPLTIEATADQMAAPEGTAARVLKGPIRIAANGALSAGGVTLSTSQISTAVAKAGITGTAALNFSTFDLALTSDFQTLALSAPAVALAGERIAISGKVARAASGALNATELAVRGTGLTIDGSAGLNGNAVSADVRGMLNVAPPADGGSNPAAISGQAQFVLAAKGPIAQPDVDISLNSKGLKVGGRELADLKLAARGAFTGSTPSGTVELSGLLDGKPISGAAKVSTEPNGQRRISGLSVKQGDNAVTGDILLTPAPVGRLNVAVPDIGPLAALALQQMSGDLAGTVDLSVGPRDMPVAAVKLASKSLAVAGNTLKAVAIDLSVDDYLGKPLPTGTIRAQTITAGSANLSGLTIDLERQSEAVHIDAKATANGVPVALSGRAQIDPTETVVTLESLTAAIEKAAISLKAPATVTVANGETRLSPLTLAIGGGSLALEGSAGTAFDLTATLTNVPAAVANPFVAGLDAAGSISGKAKVSGAAGDPTGNFDISAKSVEFGRTRAAKAPPISAQVSGDYAGGTLTLARADASIGNGQLSAAGSVGQELDITASLDRIPVALANGFVAGLDASGTISGTATAKGTPAKPDATFELKGDAITAREIAEGGVPPVQLDIAGRYQNAVLTLDRGQASVGTGSLTASGTVGPDRIDLDTRIKDIPLGLANGFVPGLKAQGTLSGIATAGGSLAKPTADFDIQAIDVSTAQTRDAKAPALKAIAKGRFENEIVSLAAARIDVGTGSVTATGTAGRTLDLTVAIADIPAALAGAAAPGIDPTGTINGTLRASGPASAPAIDYRLNVAGLTLAQTRDAGVGPLGIDANGQFADKRLTLDANLSGDGLAFRAGGSVMVSAAPALDLTLNGTAPLALANRILAEGGRSAKGVVAVDLRVSGTASQPDVVGTISTSGASFTDSGANLAVNAIATTITLGGQTATISAFSAKIASGGTISAGGSVGLTNGFPADVTVKIAGGRYNDGDLIAATLDADLTLTGPLATAPKLAGTINAKTINILVPERLPTSLSRIDVKHKNSPAAVLKQASQIEPKSAKGGGGGNGLALDLTFNAPREVFVRGRGLDIELGGSIRIQGFSSAPSINGAFNLTRGRFQILGNRLDFQRGILTFSGELIPTLDLLATSDSGDVTVSIAVTGPATDPSFNFSSTPALPQDEVLARLIFKQGTANLSPLQIAQLAEAAAQLAGVGGSTGLLENLRSQIGVDDLDIKTAADGQTSVGVGKYLNDRTYLGVDSTGRVSIDLNVGGGVKARGAVTATGGGEVGVFYEHEY